MKKLAILSFALSTFLSSAALASSCNDHQIIFKASAVKGDGVVKVCHIKEEKSVQFEYESSIDANVVIKKPIKDIDMIVTNKGTVLMGFADSHRFRYEIEEPLRGAPAVYVDKDFNPVKYIPLDWNSVESDLRQFMDKQGL